MLNFRFGRRLAEVGREYDFPPFRPPNEAESLLLRVTRGCPWNRCAFCPMYRQVGFQRRSTEAVKEDIDTAGSLMGGMATTAFIGDSDSLVTDLREFRDILDHLYRTFPSLTRVTTYARAQTLRRRSPAGLVQLRRSGLTRVHVGLETGSARLLTKIRKGATPETMVDGCQRAKEAGFELSLYVLLGIGGRADWSEHASETARVLNRIDPHFIRVRTLSPQPGTAVYQWWREGSFEMPGPEEILVEQKSLIQGLDVTSEYLSDHVSNYALVNGRLPEAKGAMLTAIDDCLERIARDKTFRARLEGMPYQRRL